MKLLEDMPSAVTHRPPERRTWLTLTVTVALLLAAAGAGAYLIAQSGGTSPEAATEGAPEVTLAVWAESATAACATVAREHPIMKQGAEARTDVANVPAVEAGTRALVAAIRALPSPGDEPSGAKVSRVVASGHQADQAWAALAVGPGDATTAELAGASALSTAFVTGLTDLGANCSALG